MNWQVGGSENFCLDDVNNIDNLLLNTTSNYQKIVLYYKIANTLYKDKNKIKNLSKISKYCELGIELLKDCADSNDILQDYLVLKSNILYYSNESNLSWKLYHSAYLLNPKRLIESRDDLISFINLCLIKKYYDIPEFIFKSGYVDINTNTDLHYTPFIVKAVKSRDNERIQFLLDLGADITIVNNYDDDKQSALSIQIYKFFKNSEGSMDYDFDESTEIERTYLLLSKVIPNERVRKNFLQEILAVYEKYNEDYELVDKYWKNLYTKYTDPNQAEIIDDYKYF